MATEASTTALGSIQRALATRDGADALLDGLARGVARWIGEGCPPLPAGAIRSAPGRATDPGAAAAAHAAALLAGGADPLEALDGALLRLLFLAEARAIRASTAPHDDPAGLRSTVTAHFDALRRLVGDAPGRGHEGRPRALRNRNRNLQLMLTRRCQLRCTYCPVVKGPRDMPPAVIDAAVDLLLSSRRRRLRLDFSGGEPLLHLDGLRRAVGRLRAGAARDGREATFYLVTNGFLMTPAIAEELAAAGVRVELSLDGTAALHNAGKPPVDPADDPYRRTRAALACARAAGLDHTVVMVVSPDTVAHLRAGVEHARSLGVRSLDINYAIGRRWSGEPLRAYLAGLDAVIDTHADALADGSLRLGNLSSRREPALLNAEWMVDTDGSLHRMTEWALESRRPPGAADRGWGEVGALGDWDALWAGRSDAYHTLLATYGWHDAALRSLIHDNLVTGRAVAAHLARRRAAAPGSAG